jgi:hypothetical protein
LEAVVGEENGSARPLMGLLKSDFGGVIVKGENITDYGVVRASMNPVLEF